jgi:hypothetical protein
MRLESVVVYNIGGIGDIVSCKIVWACFLGWSLVCCLGLGLYYCLGI